ncbi:MAG TPA: enoyl-CoA hydratase-related protein [Terriglobales bacterium]|jgi:methylglutaconyl-CoA hydratase|nr:enoyl-CoA hydratase-related protein [Terriglobales bacterium]
MKLRTIRLTESDGIATLTFNRPDKRNAISYELIEEMFLALESVERGDAQVLIVTGAGVAFCAGMDLENLRAITTCSPAQNLGDSRTMARLFRAIYDFPKPTIAAVNGAAMGGGCGIATLCDFTVASEQAKFGYTEVKIGFLPAIVSTFLIQQIGEKRARDLLMTGRIFSAEEAKQMGIVADVLAGEQLMERARELAGTLMQASPASLRATKRLLSAFAKDELDRRLGLAVEENARIRATDDFREGITAFLERRKPHWSGK